jgi:branched-subunit amino acid aminotransferase/4-amino-4-deoxychorismate lyase
MGMVYLNGELVDASAATVSAFDAGVTHGAGLFTTLRSYGGKLFALDRHLARLAASATALSIPFPADTTPWIQAATDVLAANGLDDARMRITVTAGDVSRAASESGERDVVDATEAAPPPFPGTVLITAAPLTGYPPELYQRGMTVMISPYRQPVGDPTAGHKTVSYFPRLLGLRSAQMAGCAEALWFTPDNRLAEACISNVFLVREGRLATPVIETPVLPGVMRGVVIELAREAGIEAEETTLTINDVLAADEVFLTNSIVEIMPVTAIERHTVGGGAPGKMVHRLAGLLRARIPRDCGLE